MVNENNINTLIIWAICGSSFNCIIFIQIKKVDGKPGSKSPISREATALC